MWCSVILLYSFIGDIKNSHNCHHNAVSLNQTQRCKQPIICEIISTSDLPSRRVVSQPLKATNARSGTVGLDLLLNKTYTSTLYAVSGSKELKVHSVTAFVKERLNEMSLLSTLIITVEGVELGFQWSSIDVDLTRGGWKTNPSGNLS